MIRFFRLSSVLGLLLLSVGCARWTMRPPNAPPMQQRAATGPEKPLPMNPLAALVSGQRRRQQPKAETHSTGEIQPASAQTDIETLDLKNLDPSLAIARLTERQGDPLEARRMYNAYLQRNADHPLPYHRLGVMAAREAKYEQAEGYFQKAMQLGPPTVELLSDVGYLYYLQDRLDEAQRVLSQASQAEPANATVHNNLALVQAAKGDFDGSLRNFRRVNTEAESRANLAYSYTQHGDLQKARSEYLTALTLDNKLKIAAKALLQVETANKQRQRSVAQAQAKQEQARDPLLRSQPSQDQVHVDPQRRLQIGAPNDAQQVVLGPQGAAARQAALNATHLNEARSDAIGPQRQVSQADRRQPTNQQLQHDFSQMLMPLPNRRGVSPHQQDQQAMASNVALASATEPVEPTAKTRLPRREADTQPQMTQQHDVVQATHFEPVPPPDRLGLPESHQDQHGAKTPAPVATHVTPVRALFGDLNATTGKANQREVRETPQERSWNAVDTASEELPVRTAGHWDEEPHHQSYSDGKVEPAQWAESPPSDQAATNEQQPQSSSGVTIGIRDNDSKPSTQNPVRFEQPARIHIEPTTPPAGGVEIKFRDSSAASATLSDSP